MKRILFIVYNFPPAAGAATQRVLKFLKYLNKFGHRTFVLTVDKVDYPDLDFTLMEKIPNETKIFRTKYWTPFGIYRKLTGRKPNDKIPVAFIKDNHKSIAERISVFLRLNVFLPDAKIGWLPYAIKEGKKIIKEEKIDVIISSGPPHTTHLIACALKKKTNVKWIADFRDPWTDIDYYSGMKRTKLAEWIDRKLETTVLKNSDYVIAAGEGYLEIIKSKGVKNNYAVVTNGFDPDDFQNIELIKQEKFILTYTGNMPITRNPENLWNALEELYKENADFAKNFEFHFAGVMDEEIRLKIKEQNFYSNFIDHGYLSHNEVLKLNFNSHLLIMIVNRVATSNEILPGKLFEYFATGNYILVIGPENGVSARLVRYVGQGNAVDYENKDEIKKIILELFEKWREGKIFKIDSPRRNEFTREEITKKLEEIIFSLFEKEKLNQSI
ncbi:MAG: glycosyltransferase family 4 protein [Ignavibacterium sp.]|nr:glycosyltransferase family 4 protein [Ignavibacterium sp.]